jgi:ABC-2 type transport system permease protein
MTISRPVRFAVALAGMNLRHSLALRAAFWIQAAFMVGNNLIFFSIWWIFFRRFEEIGGWRLDDVAALFGVVAAGFGTCAVLAGGVRDLARAIIDGELDSLLLQPKPVLLQAAASRSIASGWGDIATGVGMLWLVGGFVPQRLPWTVLAVLASASVFTATAILLHSTAFWLGRVEHVARQVWEFAVTFSLYPRPLFSGGVAFLLYTLIPAGFIGFLPVALVRSPTPARAAVVATSAAAWLGLAALVFRNGLRRYASGNRVGGRG